MASNYGTNTLDCVVAALVGAGVGQVSDNTQDWFIYQDFLPDGVPSKDRAIAVYETPGGEPLQRWAIDYPGVQVKLRAEEAGYADIMAKCFDVFQALHEQEAALTTVTGSPFVYFYCKQSAPLAAGRDDRKRIFKIWNFRSMRNRPQP